MMRVIILEDAFTRSTPQEENPELSVSLEFPKQFSLKFLRSPSLENAIQWRFHNIQHPNYGKKPHKEFIFKVLFWLIWTLLNVIQKCYREITLTLYYRFGISYLFANVTPTDLCLLYIKCFYNNSMEVSCIVLA